MKKYIKVLLITALALIISGASVACLAFTLGGFRFSDLNTEHYEIMTAEITEDISELTVNTTSRNVRVIPSNSGTTTVTYPESERVHYNASVNESEDGSGYVLDIKESLNPKEKWFGINIDDPEIVVALSAEFLDMISVVTTSGDIAVEKGISADMIHCISSSGRVTVDADEVKSELYIKASSGSVKATAPARFLTVTTASGGVKVENSEYHDVLITSKSGDISMKSVKIDTTSDRQRYGLERSSV